MTRAGRIESLRRKLAVLRAEINAEIEAAMIDEADALALRSWGTSADEIVRVFGASDEHDQ